uniref:Uncharacterized protein n=1 Tax=viral metagenome TaxID=1070528 RepID=A0A6C0ECA9_9ZZZZ
MADLREAFVPLSLKLIKEPRQFSAKEKIWKKYWHSDGYYMNKIKSAEYLKNPNYEPIDDNRAEEQKDEIKILKDKIEMLEQTLQVLLSKSETESKTFETTTFTETITTKDDTKKSLNLTITVPTKVECRNITSCEFTKNLDHNQQIDNVLARYKTYKKKFGITGKNAKNKAFANEIGTSVIKEQLETRLGDTGGLSYILGTERDKETEKCLNDLPKFKSYTDFEFEPISKF